MSPKKLDDIVKKLLVHDNGESMIVHNGKKTCRHSYYCGIEKH